MVRRLCVWGPFPFPIFTHLYLTPRQPRLRQQPLSHFRRRLLQRDQQRRLAQPEIVTAPLFVPLLKPY
jgi:hypothetical protein